MRRSIRDTLKWSALILFLIVLLFPFFWIVASSLKSRGEFFARPPVWLPATPIWGNYPDALAKGGMKGLTDSFIIAFFSMMV